MISTRLWPLGLALAAAIVAGSADACSVVRGYKVPTTLELAQQADVIVVATVTGERKLVETLWNGESTSVDAVVATPTDLIKGTALPPTVALKGSELAKDEQSRGLVEPSAPRELRQPNSATLIGTCVRYFFTPGVKLVLFLKRDNHGVLAPIRSPFARDAEDVAGPDALWVKAVREYAAIGAGSKREVATRLEARVAALRLLGDADSVAIADDMDIERTGERPPLKD